MSKYKATETYLKTQDPQLLDDAREEMLYSKKRWRTFLEGLASITRLTTGPLYAVGGAALLASIATNPIVPLALGVGLLVAATASLITAVVASNAVSSMERAEELELAERRSQMQALETVKELKANAMCVASEKEAGKSEDPNCECKDKKKKNWSQTIQTAELNEAAQRQIH
jgi:hypothetical protein